MLTLPYLAYLFRCSEDWLVSHLEDRGINMTYPERLNGKNLERICQELIFSRYEYDWAIMFNGELRWVGSKAPLKYPFAVKLLDRAFSELYEGVHKEYGEKCAVCGSEKRLYVHHKDFYHWNMRKENLILLCQRCHFGLHEVHRGVKAWKVPLVLKPVLPEDIKDVLNRQEPFQILQSQRFLY